MNEEGSSYGPARYKEIVRERFWISKLTNTSYKDTQDITPIERSLLIEFIIEDLERQKRLYDKARDEAEARKNN